MGLVERLGFRGRLIAAMITLVALVSLVIGALFMVYLFEDEKNRATEQLGISERLTREVLERRTDLNLSRLSVVVQDFGFRSAVASRDPATLASALDNHSRRAGADFAVLTDSAGNPMASTLDQPIAGGPATLIDTRSGTRSFAYLQGWGYEILQVPVAGPGLRARLIAGFALDQSLATVIARLSGTEVVFRARAPGDRAFEVFAATGQRPQDMAQALSQPDQDDELMDEGRYFRRIVQLTEPGNQTGTIEAVLMLSRAASLANYYARAQEIALLVSAILVFAILLALVIARTLGRPVLQLAAYARAIGEGGFPAPPDIRTGGELRRLRNAFAKMLVQLRDREVQIRHAASHDEVTGLSNRNALMQSARELFEAGGACTLLGLRLNDLSDVNDTLGLAFGDQVLAAVAQRLRATLPEARVIARTGGGEFLALVPAQRPEQVETLARQLLAAAEAPMDINNTPFSIRALAVTMALPADAGDTNELRRRLNLTFEQAENHPDSITRYQPGRDESHLRELQLIADLHNAIHDHGLSMNYQPKLDIRTGRVTQVEALVRWSHPELGFVSPEEFIFLAEQSGQIHGLTAHILQRVAADARQWTAAGLDAGVAINLSAMDLTWPDLVDHIETNFDDWHHDRLRITLEVTESALMQNPDEALATLRKLRELGVTLSVDDFGSGYSSLSQMRKLPVQELKIDKSFVLRLDAEPQDQLIVKSTIDMAHGLGLKVVAEGIENLEAWRLLQAWGCDLGQGFHLSRPVAPADLADTLHALDARRPELTRPTMEYHQ
jgi:diguanylate cyclase (GGDEF)-like protein